mmetsp:Transcript_10656/g.19899  ORF Transcript_10656/g.19899 Transcript_10656/m.19899 type:complete len:114 (+) Transcript_10656:186-527(+)
MFRHDVAVEAGSKEILDGNDTIAPSSAPIPAATSENSLIILSWVVLSVGMLVFTIFIWNIRNQIKDFLVKCWSTVRGGRHSNDHGPTTLNDIIFDPEEEQRASLSESLLPSNE